jgi:hypothetical protein
LGLASLLEPAVGRRAGEPRWPLCCWLSNASKPLMTHFTGGRTSLVLGVSVTELAGAIGPLLTSPLQLLLLLSAPP